MKKIIIYTFLLGFLLSIPSYLAAGGPADICTHSCGYSLHKRRTPGCTTEDCHHSGCEYLCAPPFNRTFLAEKSNHQLLSNTPISIDQADAERLLAVGNETWVYGLCGRTAYQALDLTMDIGIASDEAQAWTLPANMPTLIFSAGSTIMIDPDDISVLEAQEPDATHVSKQNLLTNEGEQITVYRHFEYSSEFGLDILGKTILINGEFNADFEQDTDPFTELPLDFGDEFESEDQYSDTNDYYPLISEESYSEVDAFGTIHTPFGSFECLVLFNTVEYTYIAGPEDTSGVEIDYEISWITKEGFTFTGKIPGQGVEGVVRLNQLIMTFTQPSCPENNNLTYPNVPVQKHQASKTLTSNGIIHSFDLPPSPVLDYDYSTTFTAGESITLNAGFTVPAGTEFNAYIAGCQEPVVLVENQPPPPYIPSSKEETEDISETELIEQPTSRPRRNFFSNFTATVNTLSEVELHATFVSEQGNAPLLVERSIDGKKFIRIGVVQGDGSTAHQQNYSFTDISPNNGVNHYRLREMNSNSRTGFSKVIQVLVSNGGTTEPVIAIYPNPGKNKVWFSENAHYELFDQAGNLITWGHATGSLDVSQLRKGVYFVKINDGEMLQWVKK